MPPISLAVPSKPGKPTQIPKLAMCSALAERGFIVNWFSGGWRPEFGNVLFIPMNPGWYPQVKRQLLNTPPGGLPPVVVWHLEPLPSPRISGLPWPWIDHREIARILVRDPWATDPYTNYFNLWRLHRRGLPDLLVTSTLERVQFLRERGIPAEHVPLGYHPEQGRDLGVERDIDVLFLGHQSLRRRLKVAYLRRRGVDVTAAGDWNNPNYWGEERTRLINRARIFLNIPRFEGQLALGRFILGACNKSLIVSEPLYNSAPFVPGEHYIAAEYKEMPSVIEYYLNHEEERARIAEAGYRLTLEKCRLSDSAGKMAGHIERLVAGK